MKKIATIICAVLSASYVVQASAAGTQLAPKDPAVVTQVDSTTCAMVSATSPFQFAQSKNVGVSYICDTTAIAVNAGNTKGKFTYGGSSNGGSVHQCATGTTADVTANGYLAGMPSAATTNGCS